MPEQLDRLFHALADGTRRDIVRRTLTEELSVSALAADYAMSFAAVQKHVAVLEGARLVRKTAVGRTRLVRAEPSTLARARTCLQGLESLWAHRLAALDDVLGEPRDKE
jgi:DNA-binding transcriptional ArsR family regulator